MLVFGIVTACILSASAIEAGPLYGAFPVAYILHKKGCSVKNIFIYLGAFSTLKIPMLGLTGTDAEKIKEIRIIRDRIKEAVIAFIKEISRIEKENGA